MPEETRYFTLSGNVPNGGVPYGRMLASVAGLPLGPNPGSYPPPQYSGPQNNAQYGPPPQYDGLKQCGNGGGYQPYYPTLHPGPPPSAPCAPAAPTPAAPVPGMSQYEPPGQYIDGHMLHGADWSYITPSENTTIHFVGDGTRPCDAPNGYYPHQFDFTKHKVPSMMTVKDLIKQLGAPADERCGITEMEELGDARFLAGLTITQGSEDAAQTLAEIGWTQRRSELGPIWVLVKN